MISIFFLVLSLSITFALCDGLGMATSSVPAETIDQSSVVDMRLLVKTKFGPIYGTYYPSTYQKFNASSPVKVSDSDSRAFLGIPFAKPPLEKLRFAQAEAWNWTWLEAYGRRVLKATRFRSQCLQFFPVPLKELSEDCLHLNIYTPPFSRMASLRRSRKLLPVMFWIFGGAFSFGGSGAGNVHDPNVYTGSFVTRHKDVIIVTFNHRLSSLGFLRTEELEGNYAISDQKMALRWTFENIEAFGGNPNKITVFGMSSGAYCAMLLALDPTLPQLAGVISMSSPASLRPKSVQQALEGGDSFIKEVRCQKAINRTECLQTRNALSIMKATWTSDQSFQKVFLSNLLKWPPVESETNYISRFLNKIETLTDEQVLRIRSTQFMIGVAKDEVSFFVELAEVLKEGSGLMLFRGKQPVWEYLIDWMVSENSLTKTLLRLFRIQWPSFAERKYLRALNTIFISDKALIERVLLLYPVRQTIAEVVDSLVNILTDYIFTCPNRNIARRLSNLTTTYFYQNNHRPPWSFSTNKTWIAHSLDLPYFWQFFPPIPDDEKGLANLITDYFTSFAHGNLRYHCNPLPLSATRNREFVNQHDQETFSSCNSYAPEWTPFSEDDERYMAFGVPDKFASMQTYREGKCKFWDSVGYPF